MKHEIPSNIGLESTTITENCRPSSIAPNKTFCTTDDLIYTFTAANSFRGEIYEPGESQDDVSILDFLHSGFLNDLICDDDSVPNVIVDLQT